MSDLHDTIILNGRPGAHFIFLPKIVRKMMDNV